MKGSKVGKKYSFDLSLGYEESDLYLILDYDSTNDGTYTVLFLNDEYIDQWFVHELVTDKLVK